jgi:hypothetical protein
VLKRPNLLFNLARVEQLTGHTLDAIGHYKAFLADGTVTVADRETARKHVAELSPLVGHILIDAPIGAEVSIDGQTLPGKAPVIEPADVATGAHTVEARLGSQSKTASVSCEAGQTVTAKIELEIAPPPVPVVAPAPAPVEPPEASVQVRTTASGAKIDTVVILGGLAVAAIVIGVAMEVTAESARRNESGEQTGELSSCFGSRASTLTRCNDLASDVNDKLTDENGATAAFIAGGVFAAATALAWAAWPNRRVVESRRRLVPHVAPGVAGLEFVTAF